MLDELGRALTSIDPGGEGRVHTHGEIWTATASEPITAGDPVRVVSIQGLRLTVRPAPGSRTSGGRETGE
jgi:membrane-bound ClpP family serine protease